MEKTLAVLNELKKEGLITDYAIGGGIAAIFYIEPILTYDLDIFISLGEENNLQPLAAIYRHLKAKGYKARKEQVIIEGIPVQFLPVYNELLEEAVTEAREIIYKGVSTRVMAVEHLLAIMLQTRRAKDRERFFKVWQEARINQGKFAKILEKFSLREKFEQWKKLLDEK